MELTKVQNLIYSSEKYIGGAIGVMCGIMTMDKHFSEESLVSAIKQIYRTNYALNLKLDDTGSEPALCYSSPEDTDVEIVRVSDVSELDAIGEKAGVTPFDMTGSLSELKAVVYPQGCGIIVRLHHLLGDAHSMLLIATQFSDILEGKDTERYSYEEYCDAERKYLNSDRCRRDAQFFCGEFEKADVPELLSNISTTDFETDILRYSIPENTVSLVEKYAEATGVSVYSCLLSAYAFAYSKLKNDAETFYIGVPSDGRISVHDFSTVGMYINNLPVRISLDYEKTAAENVLAVQSSLLSTFKHQRFSYNDILEVLRENYGFRGRLFDCSLNFQKNRISSDSSMHTREYMRNVQAESVQLFLNNRNGEKDLCAEVVYRRSTTDREKAEKLFELFCLALDSVCSAGDTALKKLNLISEKDISLINGSNMTDVAAESFGSVNEKFRTVADGNEDRIAVTATDRELTYRELDEESNRVANALAGSGVKKGSIVAFRLSRKSYLISVMLGIIKAGAAYLPIDPEYPEERTEYMLGDSGAVTCLTDENITDYTEFENSNDPSVIVERADPCYVIYTSGSTGKPKGTVITHGNVLNYCSGNDFNIFGRVIGCDTETILSVTTVGFDIFVTESILTLLNAMSILLADETQSRSQSALALLLREHPADVIQTTPTKMKSLISDKTNLDYLKAFKTIILGGESLPAELFSELKEHTKADIFNVYGPSETTVWVSAKKVVSADDISLGTPLANTEMFVLDRYLNRSPLFATGEICIAGACVGSGYTGKPELTSERFTDNPFGEGKLYRTGDSGYRRNDGEIIFTGRTDSQIKLNGQRVELGEIESVLQKTEYVEQAVVTMADRDDGRRMLCAFYTGKETDPNSLRTALSAELPGYMIPGAFVYLEEMPVTGSGKLDKNRLYRVSLEQKAEQHTYIAPSTEEEKLVCSSVEHILGISNVGTADNFVELGGDSLKAIELAAVLEKEGLYISPVSAVSDIDISATVKSAVRNAKKEKTGSVGNLASFSQRDIYIAQKLAPDMPLYNVPCVIRCPNVDRARLRTAVDSIIGNHRIFRTGFRIENDEIIRFVSDSCNCRIEEISGEAKDFIRPFDMDNPPLMRVGIKDDIIIFDIHHIVFDGLSISAFFAELNEYYMGRETNAADSEQQNCATRGDEEYWLEEFSDGVPEFSIGIDKNNIAKDSFAGRTIREDVPSELTDRVFDYCSANRVTPFAYCLAAYQILLSKYTCREDLVIGIPVNRRKPDELGRMGMYVSTLPVRCKPECEKSVPDFLSEVVNNHTNAMNHADISVSSVISGLNSDCRSLFDTTFTYQPDNISEVVFGDETRQLIPIIPDVAKYSLEFAFYPRRNVDSTLLVTYNDSLIDESTAERMKDSYIKILGTLADSDMIGDISAVSDEDKALMESFNHTEKEYRNDSVYGIFRRQVEKHGNRVCITDNDRKYTFTQLDSDASVIDAYIRTVSDGKKKTIGVIADRSYTEIAAIYGIIRGGNAYLPISPEYPEKRIGEILETADCDIVIAQDKYLNLSEKCVSVSKILAEGSNEIPEPSAEPDDLLYVIFTSGSTGKPKGAMITNRSAVNRISWMADSYFDGDTVVMLKTPYTFDVSVWEIFGFGMFGFEIFVLPAYDHYRQDKVLEYISKGNVTDIHFVPSVFEQFLSTLGKSENPAEKLSGLRNVFLSGEALKAEMVNEFYPYHKGKINVVNLYGPTECAVDVTSYRCGENETNPVPIGKPVDNTKIYVLDNGLNPVPVGVTGQICITGDNVGEGYINDAERTEKTFVANPFGGGRMYLTGDLGHWNENGLVVFEGRNDNQIKFSGQRIELGEIESALNMFEGIDRSVVILKHNPEKLVAFYTGRETGTDSLRMHMQNILPSYMIPSAFVRIEEIPLSMHGKTDYSALDRMEYTECETGTLYEKPADSLEESICLAFENVLGVRNVGRNQNFYELGGTSFDVMKLLESGPLSVLSPPEFMGNPVPWMLAEMLRKGEKRKRRKVMPLYTSATAKKAVILFPYGGGDAAAFTELVSEFRRRNSEIDLYCTEWMGDGDYETAAEEILEIAAERQVSFCSHCAGSVIALKLLEILNRDRQTIHSYTAMANIPPKSHNRPVNFWKKSSDKTILKLLKKAGLDSSMLSGEKADMLIANFRRNTDEYFEGMKNLSVPVRCSLYVIVSKKDIFTTNYCKAEKIWASYVSDVMSVTYLDSVSHYFQNTEAARIVDLICNML